MSDKPIFLEGHLLELTGGDHTIQKDILNLFFENAAQYILDLKEEIGDRQAFQAMSHKLRGAARSIGAVKLAEIAHAAEEELTDDPVRHAHHANAIENAFLELKKTVLSI